MAIFPFNLEVNLTIHEKVLLGERKRHTAQVLAVLLFPRGWEIPTLDRGVRTLVQGSTPPIQGRYPLPKGGTNPLRVDRQTPVKTVPSQFLRNADGKNVLISVVP